jgi:hypothetical protein
MITHWALTAVRDATATIDARVNFILNVMGFLEYYYVIDIEEREW